MIVFLQTPRSRIWELSNPAIIGTVSTTHFNHNPANPSTLMNHNLRPLIDNIVITITPNLKIG